MGDWFKAIISSKKAKDGSSKQAKGSASAKSNGFKWKNKSQKQHTFSTNCFTAGGNARALDMPAENVAAIRIQNAFRVHMAKKKLRHLKGAKRLQILMQNYSVKKQCSTSLYHLHSWSKMQSEIRMRRLYMVTEGRLKQKKLEHQLKLEAKLHDLEVEWSGGSETMEEVLARIHHREEAAVKRERAMAYAFSHQWRANSSPSHAFNYELGKANWGWSWKERWIAARPWESRVPIQPSSSKKPVCKQASKVGKTKNSPAAKAPISAKSSPANGKSTNSPAAKTPVSAKPSPTDGKNTNSPAAKAPVPSTKPRRLLYPAAETQATIENVAETNHQIEQLVT